MNIKEFDVLARRRVTMRTACCEVCGGYICGNEVLDDHHIIGRDLLLTRWADWNHLIVGRECHKDRAKIRRWVEENRPDIWRKIRRCEMRRDKRGYHEHNMRPARVRARLNGFTVKSTKRCEKLLFV